MRLHVAVIALAALAALTGCPSVSTTGLARTLNRGAMQGFVAPGTVSLEGVWLPQVEVGGRYGITDHVEIGAKAWLIGAGLDTKISLLRSPSMQGGLDLALDPNVSYFGMGASVAGTDTTSFGLLTVGLPLLVGVNFSGHQLVLGPKLVGHVVFGTTGDTTVSQIFTNNGRVLGGGATVGVAFRVGREFRLMPEVTYVRYFWSNAPDMPGASLIQGGLTVLFGGGYEPPEPKE